MRIAESAEAATRCFTARRAALPALSRLEPLTLLEDATVPRSRIAEMVDYIQELAKRSPAEDRHVRPRRRRQPASDRGARPSGRGRGAAAPVPRSMRSSRGRSSSTARSPASTESASRSCATSSASSAPSTWRCCGGSRPRSTRTASSTPESSVHDHGVHHAAERSRGPRDRSLPNCSTDAFPAASVCPPARHTS